MPVYVFQDFFPPWTALLGSPRLLNFQKIFPSPFDDDDDDGVFLFQEKHETQELYIVTSPRLAWG